MKKNLLFILGMLIALPGFAHTSSEFTYRYEGHSVNYKVNPGSRTCQTNPGLFFVENPDNPDNGIEGFIRGNLASGDLILPSHPENEYLGEVYTLTEIGEFGFCYNENLSSVYIPETVKNIGFNAFMGCSGLQKVTLPDSLESINYTAFLDCTNLQEITLPNSLKFIGAGAFENCSSLQEITLPDSLEEIISDTFAGCSGLTSITIPEAVTRIGWGAFSDCSGLTSITIPEAVTNISYRAFSGCSGLSTVILPKMLETLDDSAFEECYKVRNVVYTGTNPVECDSDVFADEVYQNATLYVPSGRIEAFRSVKPWKSFYNITDEPYSGVENVIADFNEDAPYDVFNLNGVKVAESTDNLPTGIYIIRQGNAVKKIAVK